MICPGCKGSFWGLFSCADGVHRCSACKDSRGTLTKFVQPVIARSCHIVEQPKKEHRQARIRANGKRYTQIERHDLNLCVECENPAKFYGDYAGYGLKCEACNKAQNEKRARRLASSPLPS